MSTSELEQIKSDLRLIKQDHHKAIIRNNAALYLYKLEFETKNHIREYLIKEITIFNKEYSASKSKRWS
jgi:hypothetical protein